MSAWQTPSVNDVNLLRKRTRVCGSLHRDINDDREPKEEKGWLPDALDRFLGR